MSYCQPNIVASSKSGEKNRGSITSFPVKRILLDFSRLLLLSALVLFYLIPAAAAEQDNSFSFVVFGDNRLPGYLPYTSDQLDEAEKCFEQMKLYAFGPDLAVDTEISFDPDTGKLDWIKYWPRYSL